MIQFLNPVWLWALMGLAIPIGIHLLSRKEGKVFLVGSTRFLAETSTARFRSIRLNELLLLALRCLLIIVLVLFIAGLTFPSDHREKWLLIEPGLEKTEHINELRDSLSKSGFQIRSFSPGFPVVADSVKDLNYWGLVEALKKKPLQHVVILSRQYAANFKGERIALTPNIQWISFPPEQQRNFITDQGIKGSTDEETTSFENDVVPSISRASERTKIGVFHDPFFSYDKDVLVAVLKSIQEFSGEQFDIELNPSDQMLNADWRFYLGAVPDNRGNIIRYDASAEPGPDLLMRDYICNNCYLITDRLTQDLVLNKKFTLQLMRVLLSGRDSLFTNYPDARVMPDKMLWKSGANGSFNEIFNPANEDPSWLLFVFVTLLIVERYVSRKRNQ